MDELLASHRARDTLPARIGARFRTLDEKLEAVAAGRGVAFATEAAPRYAPGPDVRYVPVTDLSPSQLVIAWRGDRVTPLVLDFVEAAKHARDTHALSPATSPSS